MMANMMKYVELAQNFDEIKKNGTMLVAAGSLAYLIKASTDPSRPPVKGAEFVHRYPHIYKNVVTMERYKAAFPAAYEHARDASDRFLAYYEGLTKSPDTSGEDVSLLVDLFNLYENYMLVMVESTRDEDAFEIFNSWKLAQEEASALISSVIIDLKKRGKIYYTVKSPNGSKNQKGRKDQRRHRRHQHRK